MADLCCVQQCCIQNTAARSSTSMPWCAYTYTGKWRRTTPVYRFMANAQTKLCWHQHVLNGTNFGIRPYIPTFIAKVSTRGVMSGAMSPHIQQQQWVGAARNNHYCCSSASNLSQVTSHRVAVLAWLRANISIDIDLPVTCCDGRVWTALARSK